MAYDSVRGATVLFGGYDARHLFVGDTWYWAEANWTQWTFATAPSARVHHAMAYDSARGVTVLFGGYAGSNFGDTWEHLAVVRADFDGDGDVDLTDFGGFQACFNGPNRPPAAFCAVGADLDGDGDVDLADFGMFQTCFNGPNRPPGCAG